MAEKYYGILPYAFCNNNPVNFVDPDGLSPIDTLEIEPAVIVETQVYKAQNEIIKYLPMITYARQADIA